MLRARHFVAAGAALLSAAAAGNGQNPPAQDEGPLRASLPNTATARAKARNIQIQLYLRLLLPQPQPQSQDSTSVFFVSSFIVHSLFVFSRKDAKSAKAQGASGNPLTILVIPSFSKAEFKLIRSPRRFPERRR
jgi:hypothetical protein